MDTTKERVSFIFDDKKTNHQQQAAGSRQQAAAAAAAAADVLYLPLLINPDLERYTAQTLSMPQLEEESFWLTSGRVASQYSKEK